MVSFIASLLYDVNQYLKNNDAKNNTQDSYYYCFANKTFYLSNDNSNVSLKPTNNIFEYDKLNFKFIYIEDSKELYSVLKELKKEKVTLTKDGLFNSNNELIFNKIKLTNTLDVNIPLHDYFNKLSSTKFKHELDESISILYNDSIFKSGPISINDFIEVNKHQYEIYDHRIIFLEIDIKNNSIKFVPSKTRLGFDKPTLISINNFKKIKVLKRTPYQFFKMKLNDNLIMISYGNSDLTITHTFSIFDFTNT